jgi:Peptidase family M1 domain
MRVRPTIPSAWRGAGAVAIGLVVAMIPGVAFAESGNQPATPHRVLAGVRTPAHPVYTVSLASDQQGFTWTGTESVTFVNASSTPLSTVWIRLWDNGIDGCGPSLAIQVSSVAGGTPGDLQVDCTALPITLPAAIGQGQSATLSWDLTIVVPNRNDRFGRIGSMALLGNALPLVGIQDGRGLHLDPYVSFGEAFYSQVGDFTVTLDVPAGLVTPATGDAQTVRVRRKAGRVATTFLAEEVRDFAWASGPLNEIHGTSGDGVVVRVWWPDTISSEYALDARALGELVMDSHSSAYGPYPYQEVDIVLGLFTAFGGMEYPQLVMAQTSDPVIVHELAHQWWFGLVGDDEYNDPWLDEAFASYATDIYYGNEGVGCNTVRFPSQSARVSNSMAYFVPHADEYGLVVYTIGSCALHALSRKLGSSVMNQFMRDYAVHGALGWSTTPGFMTKAQKVADGLPQPIDLTSFWHRWRIGPPG